MKFYKKIVLIVLGLIISGVVITIAFVIGIENSQFHRNKGLLSSFEESGKKSTLVVFFSRSGNTELMAHEIAKQKEGDLKAINAERYKIGFIGWINALLDSRKTIAEISPNKIDLSQYDNIYVGSPIWLYSPAPPIWEFVRNNDFTGKNVILFNSMNSKFEQKYIDDFADLVGKKGGVFVKHIYVIRGRMGQQMNVDSFLERVRENI